MSNAVIGALRVVLGMDSASFNDGVGAAQKRMAKFRKSMERTGRQLQRVGARITAGVTAPLVGLAYKSVAAQKEQERAIASVTAALESMGDEAGYSLGQLEEMAAKLQDRSLYGDEKILSKVTANLLTFGNVQGDVFARAQQSAIDMSARLGQDLQSSAIIVGKALNNPIKGLTSLTRVGVEFTDQQREQIKVMAEAGDVAGAQAIILSELEKQYSGQAEALAKTDSGRITQAWNSISDALERVGAIILPIVADFADKVKALAERFQTLSPQTQKFVVIAGTLAAAIGPVVAALGLMMTAMAPMAGVILAIVSPLGLLATGAAAAAAAIYANWEGLKADFPAITGAIEKALSLLKAQFDNTVEAASILGSGMLEQLKLAATGVEALAQGDFKGAWETFASMIVNAHETVTSALDALFGTMDDKVIAAVSDMLAPFKTWASDVAASLSADPEAFGVAIGASLAGLVARSTEAVTNIKAAFRGLVDSLQAMMSGDFAGVWASGVTAVQQFGADLLQELANLVTDAVNAAKELGRNIVDGLVAGLKEKWQSARDTVSGLARGIISGFKKETETRSPSRVFKRLGGYLVDGLVLGIGNGLGRVQAAAGQLASAMNVKGLAGETESAQGAFQSIGSTAASVFGKLGKLIGQGTRRFQSFSDVLKDVAGNLSRVLLQQAQTSLTSRLGGTSSIGGSLVSGLFSGLLGFANGGSFDVGGIGGIDSQVVAFRATPNERVHITKPGQGLGEGGIGRVEVVNPELTVTDRGEVLMRARVQGVQDARSLLDRNNSQFARAQQVS